MSGLSRSTSMHLARSLVQALPNNMDRLFNPYLEVCEHDALGNGPVQRVDRLASHLECDPRFILVGEAPGYQGCRYSGIAFTSERLLMEGAIPRVKQPKFRLTTRNLPFSEPSATIVWGALKRLGIEREVVMWNALQMHPHQPNDPWTNRTPTNDELKYGERSMRLLVEAYPNAQVVAIGKKSEQLLRDMGIEVAASVRHPANGGAKLFGDGLDALLMRNNLVKNKTSI